MVWNAFTPKAYMENCGRGEKIYFHIVVWYTDRGSNLPYLQVPPPIPSFRPELGSHKYSQPFATDHDYLINWRFAGTM